MKLLFVLMAVLTRLTVVFRFDPGRLPARLRLVGGLATLLLAERVAHPHLDAIGSDIGPQLSLAENAKTRRGRRYASTQSPKGVSPQC